MTRVQVGKGTVGGFDSVRVDRAAKLMAFPCEGESGGGGVLPGHRVE
jgi:hypothetical protein